MFVLLLLACCCVSALAQFKPYYYPEEADLHFKAFMSKYNKQYASEEEKATRFEIFKANLVTINSFNLATNMAVYGVTQFSDLTREEFIQKHTGFKGFEGLILCPKVYNDSDIPSGNAPDSFDWRQKNVVNPPKNQGACGSCYAFSAVGSIESQYMIKHGSNVSLSEQQIVDCDKTSDGCDGGYMSNAMLSIMKTGGIMSESDYPYKAKHADKCGADSKKAVVNLSSCNSYNLTSQDKVKEALYKYGPISIVISSYGLLHYHGGIIPDTRCNTTFGLDHAVLLVGYGSDASGDYWIVKNSYGLKNGEDGYFRMQRSSNLIGACGMLNNAMALPIVE